MIFLHIRDTSPSRNSDMPLTNDNLLLSLTWPYLPLLSLTGPYCVLLCRTVPYWALLGLTGPYWALLCICLTNVQTNKRTNEQTYITTYWDYFKKVYKQVISMLKLGCLFKNFHWSVCIAKIHKSKSQWRFWTSVLISCTLSTQLVWIKIKIEEIYHIASHAHQILFPECASIHRKIYVWPESSCGGAVSVWRLCSDKAGVMTRCVPSVSWIQPFVRAGSEMVSRYTATTAHCTLGHWLVSSGQQTWNKQIYLRLLSPGIM